MLSIKSQNILMISHSQNFFRRISVFFFFTKLDLSIPKTRYLYLHWPWNTAGLINYFNLSFSFEWGNSCVEGREVEFCRRIRSSIWQIKGWLYIVSQVLKSKVPHRPGIYQICKCKLMYCFELLCLNVPNIASGLSNLDFPFGFL